MTAITLVEAINQALKYEMAQDESVVVLGQDVGVNGGVFRATDGLQPQFGEQRVRDTPLAENMIAGLTVGMAIAGLKPVAEIQFADFMAASVDQIFSHAGRMRNRTRGRLHCPLVIRAPNGGGIHAPEHHSESMESLFAPMPGIRVVVPSTPANAYGLLLASIRDPDPVIFLEPKRLYRLMKEVVPADGQAMPLDVCFQLREGKDITLVSWGAMLYETLKVADALEKTGVGCDVIDLVTIKPLDIETIIESVTKTGRCVIVEEGKPTCSVSADIAAQLAEIALPYLLAPIQRVTGFDTAMPLSRLEHLFLPTVQRIQQACHLVLEFT